MNEYFLKQPDLFEVGLLLCGDALYSFEGSALE